MKFVDEAAALKRDCSCVRGCNGSFHKTSFTSPSPLVENRSVEMRRKDREVTDPEIIAQLLATAQICRIAMVDNGEPYVVPVNYGYSDNALYIHSATAGRKIQILERNSRVCFEIESPISIVKGAEACRWGVRARSLIGYGNVEIVTDREQKRQGLDVIMRHHGKKDPNRYAEAQLDAVVILKVVIESVSCKQLGDWS